MLKRFGLCAAALLFATIGTATQAHAALVTFTTSGAFSGCASGASCSGGNTVVLGAGSSAITITFTGLGDTVLTPGLTTFGSFVATGGDGTLVGSGAVATFTMTVTQSVPAPGGSVSFTSTFNGTLRVNQSSAYILFTDLSGSIGNIRYLILEADNHTAGRSNLNAPKTGGAASNPATVEGKIVPEPASTLLLGLGFLGSAAAARRRMSK